MTFCWGLVQVFWGLHSEFCDCAHSLPTFISPPPGCTYLCQPVDVGINKTLKSRMREKWEDWMVTGEGMVNGSAKEPTRQLVAEWAVEVYKTIPVQTVRNSWMKKGFEWF